MDMSALNTGPLPPEKSLEERTMRELALRECADQWDERSPIEKLFDVLLRARMTKYRPMELAENRSDIPCFCCGQLYRPDDPKDAVNMFLCLSCIYLAEGK